jgi:ABC-type uncharacterized transport system substrate-binding protein
LSHNPPGVIREGDVMRQCLAVPILLFYADPVGAVAAETAKAHIAYLVVLPSSDPVQARALAWFTDALREHGWIEGENLTVTYRASEGVNERYAELAAELVTGRPDVIVAEGRPAVRAIEQRTKIIPILMWAVPNPVGLGLVASLARPGGNITGVSPNTEDVIGKGMQLLTEVRPGILRVVYLGLWRAAPPEAHGRNLHCRRAAARSDLANDPVDLVG